MKFASGAHLLFIREGKILLLRRFQTGYDDGLYSVVAGHLDGKETVRQAAVREAREESGLILDPDQLSVVHVMHRNKPGIEEKIEFFLRVEDWIGEPINGEPQKCDDLSWFSLQELPTNMVGYVRFALDAIVRREIYSEFGW